MKKWILAALVILFTLAPASLVFAQAPVTFSNLEVDLMPEYDQPGVLVLYHIFLAPETTLPVDLTLRIPASVDSPYNVAMRGDDGQLYNVPYESKPEGDWTLVTFNAPSSEMRFEYYDPGLQKNGPSRAYAYSWPGDYKVDSLSILVQQPVDSSKMEIEPSLGSGLPGEGNLMIYNAVVGAVAQDQPFNLSVKYEKTSDRLSSSILTVKPASPISEAAPGRLTVRDVLPWGIGVVALLLIAGGGYWYWQSNREVEPRQRPRHRAVREPDVEAEETAGDVYCHRCGKRAAPGDVFCRACGTRLRKEE